MFVIQSGSASLELGHLPAQALGRCVDAGPQLGDPRPQRGDLGRVRLGFRGEAEGVGRRHDPAVPIQDDERADGRLDAALPLPRRDDHRVGEAAGQAVCRREHGQRPLRTS
jgi:hypothetical protein